MSEPLTALAIVLTPTPERYAKQLASHLGRRSEVIAQEAGTLVRLAGAQCLLVARAGALELRATAPDPEALERITNVVGSHLERFGKRSELQVSWQRAEAA
jgi:hypothetical protein